MLFDGQTVFVALQVRAGNGIIYKTSENPNDEKSSHVRGTHAGPWFLANAIRSSGHFTDDVDTADIVLVDDYCLYMKWLGHLHSYGHTPTSLASFALNLAYDQILASKRWKLNHGADFIFYDPHPGFRDGWAGQQIRDKYCNDFINATMLVADRPMRTICPTFAKMRRVLVTPYNPNKVTDAGATRRLSPATPLDDRTTLLYSRTTCHLGDTMDAGKSFRFFLGQHALAGAAVDDVDVACTNPELGGAFDPFNRMFQRMSQSRFCLALPGDSASTRRLSEIMLANCIPVFAGPPYHSMPFLSLDWAAAGVFFNIVNRTGWMTDSFEWALSETTPVASPNEVRWWAPDVPVERHLVTVANAAEVCT